MASKRQELSDMLTKRLVSRYGDRTEIAADFILKEVNALLTNNTRKITQEELRYLERKVDRETKRLAERETEQRLTNESRNRAPGNSRSKSSGEGKDDTAVEIPLDNYIVFNTAQEVQHKREEREALRKKREKQIRTKQELDMQVNSAKNRSNVDEKIEADYATHVRKLHSEWVNDQANARAKVRQQNRTVKLERDEQLRNIQERRARARKKNRDEEFSLIERAKKELAQEEKKRRQQVLDQQAYMQKVQLENIRIKKVREQEKIREQEEDKRLQREYAARLDEQERIRKETFEKMKEKSTNNQKMYILATEEKNRQDKEDEERAQMYQLNKIRENEEKARRDIQRMLQNKKEMNQTLAQQVAEFNARKTENAHAERIFAEKFKAEALKAIEDERLAEITRRKLAFKHKQDLMEQIEMKKNMPRDTDSATMTEYEQQINRVNMLELSKDKEVVEAVKQRLANQRAARTGRIREIHDDDHLL